MHIHFQPFVFFLLIASTAKSFPQQTGTITADATPAIITPAARLHCTGGQIEIHTTDCTLGTSVSYCSKPESPIQCPQGFYPSVWHPDHCMQQSTCFPLDASWITTECSNGALAYDTSTLYAGTLADGQSTIISAVSCSCAEDQWYSMTLLEGSTTYDTFCMPSSYCPPGMTTSVSINGYCVTAPASMCSDVPMETNFCKCAYAGQTPVYPEYPGAVPTGCEF
ncbi:uncharacterized protein N7511_000386 [Penicillium nucicola]|uniref:uncharacterized protein n=1 Tax=Penicillium nucicola TaxID=1850975 RepID=UPI00254536F5|nr:uncharacterized protein N7511_000386 [Penicillium nucicola]KAJ5775375.1 hypothetical protein N7511_000386 [Penicillium nucicola]